MNVAFTDPTGRRTTVPQVAEDFPRSQSRSTSRLARSPDFIIIGAQKAGTSWMAHQMSLHPDLWVHPGEVHYFDGDAEDDQGYLSLFAEQSDLTLVGEKTPAYAILSDSRIAHLKSVAPKTKLIFLVRNPVERFWSQCRMKFANGTLAAGEGNVMSLFESPFGRVRGEYSRTILNFSKHFDASQMLVCFYDAIDVSPDELLAHAFDFVGVAQGRPGTWQLTDRVNETADRSPMPESIRTRVSAAYRVEMETLSSVLGSFATSWLEPGRINETGPVAVRVTPSVVTALEEIDHGRSVARRRDRPKIFCISMQRSGTTAVGDWLESHGLRRAGYPTSRRLNWSRSWLEGDLEAVFATPEFREAEVLEDAPWWFPGGFRELSARFENSKFVLLTRPSDEWFESLLWLGGGRNPGPTDLHAAAYRRGDDVMSLRAADPSLDVSLPGLLSLPDHREKYRSIYEEHTRAVTEFFSSQPERLLVGELASEQSFVDLCAFAGVRWNRDLPIPHSNARQAEAAGWKAP